MVIRATVLLVCVLSLGGCKRQAALTPEQQAVKDCFAAYRGAVLEQNGTAATQHVDRNTIDYYSHILDRALHATPDEARALNALDRGIVLLIRHTVPLESALEMDGRRLFIHMVNTGYGRSDLSSSGVGDIKIANDTAMGVCVQKGQATPMNWLFRLEDGRWRLDLTAQFADAVKAYDKMLAGQDVDLDTYILKGLESRSGRAPAATIWEPMVTSDPAAGE